MKKLLFVFLLSGCVATTVSLQPLPASLVGVWVSPDFAASNDEAEPDAGTIWYIAEDGVAELYTAPIANTVFKVTYQPTTRKIVLQSVMSPEQEGPVVTLSYDYDPQTETITLRKLAPPGSPSDANGLHTFRRFKTRLPAFIRKSFESHSWHGSPYIQSSPPKTIRKTHLGREPS